MKLNAITSISAASPSFKGVYVTTSTKNHGDYVDNEAIKPFNSTAQKIAAQYGKEFEDIIHNTNTFVLGAGSGSRFMNLAHKQGDEVNKISFAIMQLKSGKNLHMLDLPMAMASPLIDERGLTRVNAEVARGSFAEVVKVAQDLRNEGKPQKNVIVMCGDNLFDAPKNNPFELLHFAQDIINNPSKQMGLIGVEREPDEVVNKFGVLKVSPSGDDDIMQLGGFVEKPKTIEKAREYETPAGKCIANTGMFILKAEAMEWLLDELENDKTFLAKVDKDGNKDKKEIYDFAKACELVQSKYGDAKCDVKIVDTWEDAGEPEALYRTIDEFKKGHFLTCLPDDMQEDIKRTAAKIYDGTSLLASSEAVERFGTAENLTNKINELTGIRTKLSQVDGTFVASNNLDLSA